MALDMDKRCTSLLNSGSTARFPAPWFCSMPHINLSLLIQVGFKRSNLLLKTWVALYVFCFIVGNVYASYYPWA